ncbi:MAG: cupin domain-containing protein [Lapillicoccus sp.]
MPVTVGPAVVRADLEGERRWFFGGGMHTWKVRAEETKGAFFLFEDQMEQGKMTPLHVHPDSDETMYMLEGEILMHLDGRQERVATGGVVMAPRGLPHAFMVLSPVARMLCLHTPGCCESFYWGASEPIDGEDLGSGIVDIDRVRASGEHHGGIQFVGPPPFEASPPARVVRAG